MTVNSNFNPQAADTPVAGGYVQPSSGVTAALVCLSDTAGNAVATAGAAGGVGYLGTAGFRDAQATVQASGTTSTNTAGTQVASITPGTAGLWEITGVVNVSGTTVASADSSNMELFQTSTAKLNPILYTVPGTTGMTSPAPIPPIVLNLSAVDTVNVKNIGASTAGSTYGATLVARRVG